MRFVEYYSLKLISCYIDESPESSIKKIVGETFAGSLAYLRYGYQQLNQAIRQSLQYIVGNTGDRWHGAWSDSTHDIWGKFP